MNAVEFWNDVAMEVHRRDFTFHDAFGNDDNGTPMDRQMLEPSQGGPTRTSRAFAIIHLAMLDAWHLVTPITDMPQTYTEDAATLPKPTDVTSAEAAIAGAAGTALKILYPISETYIDKKWMEWRSELLAGGEAAINVDISATFGSDVSRLLLDQRALDGSQIPDPIYRHWKIPGSYKPDPFNRGREKAVGAKWGEVRPFGFPDVAGISFQHPLGKPNIGEYIRSSDWEEQLREVRDFGGDNRTPSLQRTAEQAVIGTFWAYDGVRAIGVPPRLYNQCIRAVAKQAALSQEQTLVMLALTNLGMADAGIVAWHEKYTYHVARPVTGVREGSQATSNIGYGPDPAHNAPSVPTFGGALTLPIVPPTYAAVDTWLTTMPATPSMVKGDPSWAPLGAPQTNSPNVFNRTPPFPAYPSGHATFGTVCFEIARLLLEKYSPTKVNEPFTFVSDELNGEHRDSNGSLRTIHRRQMTLAQAIHENAVSRIYLGVHWRMDAVEGVHVGYQVVEKIVNEGRGPAGVFTTPAPGV